MREIDRRRFFYVCLYVALFRFWVEILDEVNAVKLAPLVDHVVAF